MSDAPRSLRSLLVLLLAALGVFVLLPGLFWQLGAGAGWLPPAPAERGVASMAVFGAAGLVVAALGWCWPPVRWRPVAAMGVVRAYVPFALGWLAFVIVYLQLVAALGAPVPPQPQLEQLAARGTAMPGFWLVLFGIVVVAPLAEEVLFRGYLLGALLHLLPPTAAQLVTAAAFGAVHGAAYMLPVGLLGLLFGWLRTRYGSLWPCVSAHALHNACTVALALAWPGHLELLYPR